MKGKISPLNWEKNLENVEQDSIGKDVIFLTNPNLNIIPDLPFKVNTTTAVFCLKGSISGSINLEKYTLNAPGLLIILSNQILQHEQISDDFCGHYIIMSSRFLNSLTFEMNDRLPVFRTIRENPVIPIESSDIEYIMGYFSLLQQSIKMKDISNRFYIAKHLIMALFYRLSNQYHKLPETNKKTKQEILVDNFIKNVKIYYKEQRGMEFYADKINLTPKHLSKVIKETTGKSANNWIDSHVILEAKALLKSTNMTIQQISDELNFPSQSFFGKYFKRVVGMSPKEYEKS